MFQSDQNFNSTVIINKKLCFTLYSSSLPFNKVIIIYVGINPGDFWGKTMQFIQKDMERLMNILLVFG